MRGGRTRCLLFVYRVSGLRGVGRRVERARTQLCFALQDDKNLPAFLKKQQKLGQLLLACLKITLQLYYLGNYFSPLLLPAHTFFFIPLLVSPWWWVGWREDEGRDEGCCNRALSSSLCRLVESQVDTMSGCADFCLFFFYTVIITTTRNSSASAQGASRD